MWYYYSKKSVQLWRFFIPTDKMTKQISPIHHKQKGPHLICRGCREIDP